MDGSVEVIEVGDDPENPRAVYGDARFDEGDEEEKGGGSGVEASSQISGDEAEGDAESEEGRADSEGHEFDGGEEVGEEFEVAEDAAGDDGEEERGDGEGEGCGGRDFAGMTIEE